MKIRLLFVGLFLCASAISQAGPARGGFSGRSFHAGFVARSVNPAAVHGGGFNRGGFRGRFFARRNRPIVVQQFAWPWTGYWYPYADPLSYSYLDPDSQPDYQYWDNSSAYVQPSTQVQPQPTNRAVPQNPVIIVINAGNSRPTDPNASTDPSGYANNGYIPTSATGQQRMLDRDGHPGTGAITPGDPVVPQATPVLQKNTQPAVPTGAGPFSKFVVVSYLKDRGKDVISVKNVETNDVQRVTAQPNIDHLRIVEIHPNPDLRQFEAIISNGSEQGPVRFQF